MTNRLHISGQLIEFESDRYEQSDEGSFIYGKEVSIHVPFKIKEFYQHGWQSWSLTAWFDPSIYPGNSYPKSLNVMQNDLQYAELDHPNGSWLGAVSNFEGEILFIGSLDLGSHVELIGQNIIGKNETKVGKWFMSIGKENEVFSSYLSILSKKL